MIARPGVYICPLITVKLPWSCPSAEDRPIDLRRSVAPTRCRRPIVDSDETIRDLDSGKYVKLDELYILPVQLQHENAYLT
jgi:hypothetical protein